jgi:hypothetical protein
LRESTSHRREYVESFGKVPRHCRCESSVLSSSTVEGTDERRVGLFFGLGTPLGFTTALMAGFGTGEGCREEGMVVMGMAWAICAEILARRDARSSAAAGMGMARDPDVERKKRMNGMTRCMSLSSSYMEAKE